METFEGIGAGTTPAGRRSPERQNEQGASKNTAKARSGAPGCVQVRG